MFVKQKSNLMEKKYGKLNTKLRQKTARAGNVVGNVADQGRRWEKCEQRLLACREVTWLIQHVPGGGAECFPRP